MLVSIHYFQFRIGRSGVLTMDNMAYLVKNIFRVEVHSNSDDMTLSVALQPLSFISLYYYQTRTLKRFFGRTELMK
jgi:hypothetical protein